MTAAADLILTNAEVHPRVEPDPTAEAVAIRDGSVVRVGRAYDVAFLEGVGTEAVDLDGRTLLPGFIDAHTHLEMVGRYARHADLREAEGPEECVARLRAADDGEGWLLGFGFDESAWESPRMLRRDDLDVASGERPVAAFREDMHVVAVNGVALERLDLPETGVETEDGRPTGVLREAAADVVFSAVAPDRAGTRDLLLAGQERALAWGVTGIHDVVRRSPAPVAYRDLDAAGELDLRVRLHYWRGHLDAVVEAGLRTNHGSDRVRTGAIKAFADGSFGARTAKLSAPYADGGGTGQWVTPPDELEELVERAAGEGLQVATHAIGDAAIDAVLDAYEGLEGRHRIEHAELMADEQIERLADMDVIASVQPNFLKWAGEGGLYEARLGARRERTNRFRDLLDAGVALAFGSDCMPLDPLLGIHHAVNAPAASQRLSVSEAVRAYTRGSAYAAFEEGQVGTIDVGKNADLVALERSPWEHEDDIENIDVALTVVDGEIAYDGRSANDA